MKYLKKFESFYIPKKGRFIDLVINDNPNRSAEEQYTKEELELMSEEEVYNLVERYRLGPFKENN